MKDIFHNMKLSTWMKCINIDKDNNIRQQSIMTSITYNHIWHIYKEFEKKNLIKTSKIGRQLHIQLTEKGLKLKYLFSEIEKALGDIDGTSKN